MQWTVDNGKKTYIADPSIPFEECLIRDFSLMLETALDYFLTSSYTYFAFSKPYGPRIDWLMVDDSMSLD